MGDSQLNSYQNTKSFISQFISNETKPSISLKPRRHRTRHKKKGENSPLRLDRPKLEMLNHPHQFGPYVPEEMRHYLRRNNAWDVDAYLFEEHLYRQLHHYPPLSELLIHEPSPSVTLYFGAVVHPYSQVGGCSWWMCDERKNVVGYEAHPIIQSFPSLVRLEYEALLNSLKAAYHKNFRTITICGSSEFVMTTFRNPNFSNYFTSIYALIKEQHETIQQLLMQFDYRVEILTPKENHFAHKLSENIIIDYNRKLDMKVAKLQIRYATIDRQCQIEEKQKRLQSLDLSCIFSRDIKTEILQITDETTHYDMYPSPVTDTYSVSNNSDYYRYELEKESCHGDDDQEQFKLSPH